MSYPLKELSRLLTQENTLIGVVVEINNAAIKVATARGAMTVRTLETLKSGDRVVVRHGMATRAPTASATFPV